MTTLAAIELGMTIYDWRRINNLVLSRAVVDRLCGLLCNVPAADLLGLPGLEPGREDLIGHGATIVRKTLEVFGKTSLVVSDFGLLEGALLELAERRAN